MEPPLKMRPRVLFLVGGSVCFPSDFGWHESSKEFWGREGGTLLIYRLTLFWPLLEWWISFQPCQSRFPVSFSTVIWLFWALTGSGRSLDLQNWQVRVSVTCSGNAPPATTLLVPGSRYPSRRIHMAKVDKVTDSFNGQFQTFVTWEPFPGWVSLIG